MSDFNLLWTETRFFSTWKWMCFVLFFKFVRSFHYLSRTSSKKVISNPHSYWKDFKGRWSHLDNWLFYNTSQWFPDLVPKQYWQLIACYLRNYGYQALLFNSGWVTSEKWKSEGKVLLLGTTSVSKQKVVFQNALCTQPVSKTQRNPQRRL